MTTHKLKTGDLVRIRIIADTSYLEATLMELRRLYAARLRDLEYEYQRRVSAEAELERVRVLESHDSALFAEAEVTPWK